jgi:hypothetical protein
MTIELKATASIPPTIAIKEQKNEPSCAKWWTS